MNVSRALAAALFALGVLTCPLAADAQQAANVARIGFLGATSASGWASRVEAFRLGLRELGYVEGKNIIIEFRWADEHYDRLPSLAAELLRLKVDLVVTYGTPASLAAKHATATIPIVMVHSGMPLSPVLSPASRDRARTSRVRPTSSHNSWQNAWNCSRMPYRG
jgi:ABC-type uncharacterized transport system substrate-binding protein